MIKWRRVKIKLRVCCQLINKSECFLLVVMGTFAVPEYEAELKRQSRSRAHNFEKPSPIIV